LTFQTPSTPARVLRGTVYVLFLLEALAALILALDAAVPRGAGEVAAVLGLALFVAAVFCALRFRGSGTRGPWNLAVEGRHRLLLVFTILLGLALRICWLVAVPPVQTSDYQRYLNAARNLLAQHAYIENLEGHVFRAFTPPGLPLVLAGAIRVVGDHVWMPAILNLCLYVLSSLLLALMAKRLFGPQVACVSVLLLAIWPTNIALTGLAASEPLFLLLLIGSCYFLLLSPGAALRRSPVCGLAAGLAALTRPTALTLPVLWVAALLVMRSLRANRPWLKSVALASLFLAATVAPWSLRNYAVLKSFVPVSTNGGDVFYRANNPLATGSWMPRGERDLAPYLADEALWNKTGFAWGKEWIRNHPIDFVELAAKKEVVFLASDDTGVYWAVERPYPERRALIAVGRGLCTLWWVAMWVLLSFALIAHREALDRNPQLVALLLPFLYFGGIHAIFESQQRYHIPAIPFLLILAGLAFTKGPIFPRVERVEQRERRQDGVQLET
jgi:4-amino-4-deoxy-L-arabinose transferase-like glycosyltransferase